MDKGKTLPPSPPVTPTPTHPHQPPLNPSRPASQGAVHRRKVYAPQFDPQGRRPFGSLLSRVQSCTPSNPHQRVRMRLQMEITNQEVLHGDAMVKEVLMDMLWEMRPPPRHNVIALVFQTFISLYFNSFSYHFISIVSTTRHFNPIEDY